MKKIITLTVCLYVLITIGKSNPVEMPSYYLQEFYLKNDSIWSIDIFNGGYDFLLIDSIEIRSSLGKTEYKIRELKKDYLTDYAKKSGGVIPITNDSCTVPLKFNQKGDYIVIEAFGVNNCYAYDSIIFGKNIDTQFPILDSNHSIKYIYYCKGFGRILQLSDSIKIGINDKVGINKYTFNGILYSKNNEILKNKTFMFYDFYNYYDIFGPTSNVSRVNYQTNENGEFSISILKSDSGKTETSLILENKGIPINLFTYGKDNDIHLLEDYVSAPELTNSFSLYPNPANSQATLKYDLATVDKANVEVLDITGKVIERFPLQSSTGILQLQLGSKYSAGMYVVQVKSGNTLLYSQDLIVNK